MLSLEEFKKSMAFIEAKASTELEGTLITEEETELLWLNFTKQISEEEFVRRSFLIARRG